MTNNAKWEQLLEYIVNDESDKAKELFHEIVVAESRSIYADILESEVEESEVEESEDSDAVEESMHDDDMEEGVDGNEVESFIDEVEAEEHGDETVEDASDDMEDSMSADDDMGGDDMGDMGDEEGEEGEEGEEMEDRVADLENALDELKAEFDELMSQEQNEPEHADMDMGMDGDEGEMDMSSSDDMGDEMDEMNLAEGVEMTKVPAVSNSESGVNSKSIVAKKNDFGGTAVKFDHGGDEKGGKVSAPTQHMGQAKYANSAGHKNVKMETAPKAQTKEPAGVMAKPILGK